jgi:hypothetical protein
METGQRCRIVNRGTKPGRETGRSWHSRPDADRRPRRHQHPNPGGTAVGIIFAIIVLILTFVLAAFARAHDHVEVEGSDAEFFPTERP